MPHSDPSGLIRNVIEYSTPGQTNWTKPAGLVSVEVYCLGAGGGGASGRRGAANTNRPGGSGGNGGNYVYAQYEAFELAGTVQVTVGQGGVGGPVQTLNNSNGNNGNAGGASSFGSLASAKGGTGGTGGGDGAFVNTPSPNYITSWPSASPYHALGGRGGAGITNTNNSFSADGNPNNGASTDKKPAGGGGGTGISLTNQTDQPAGIGKGGIIYVNQTGNTNWNQIAFQTAGTGHTQGAAGANGFTINNVKAKIVDGSTLYFGTSGAGGAFGNTAGTVAGGFGGGGGPGAGGGGGGGSTNGAVSGRGGDGGHGWVIIVEYIQP